MINKLRQDFQPRILRRRLRRQRQVFRDERARAMKPLRKWNIEDADLRRGRLRRIQGQSRLHAEDLRRQIPYIRRALEALRIPILEAEGFEADDVIGTLPRSRRTRHEVFIVSGDKDMMQLVTTT